MTDDNPETGIFRSNPMVAVGAVALATMALLMNNLVGAWDAPLLRAALIEGLKAFFWFLFTLR